VTAVTEQSLRERLESLFASEPDTIADSAEILRSVRERGPLYELGEMVLVTRYDDVKAVISDSVGYGSDAKRSGSRAQAIRASLTPEEQLAFDEVVEFEGLYVSRADGEMHDRLRAVAHRAFTPKRIALVASAAQEYADELLSGLASADGVCDLMSLAYRMPLMIIGDLLNIPQDDRERVHAWSNTLSRNRGGSEVGPLLAAHRAHREYQAYIDETLARHRALPQEGDLLLALMAAEQGDVLSSRELAAMFIVLLFAGHETTSNLLGIGLYELLRHPDQWAALVRDPRRIPDAVEELLRFVSPAQWLMRHAVQDVTIAAERIESGRTVIPLIASANRDPLVFANPDSLDIGRSDARRHLTFGFGRHFCLGNALARLEAATLLATMVRRFPDTQLAVDHHPVRWGGNAMLRRLVSLPVRLGAERAACRPTAFTRPST